MTKTLNAIQDRIQKLQAQAAQARRRGRAGAAWSIEATIKGLWADYKRAMVAAQKAEATG